MAKKRAKKTTKKATATTQGKERRVATQEAPQRTEMADPPRQGVLLPRPMFAGFLVAFLASVVFGVLVGGALAVFYAASGGTEDLLEEMVFGPLTMALASAVELFCFAAGGFVAARMAKQEPAKHGIAVGILMLMTGLLYFLLTLVLDGLRITQLPVPPPVWIALHFILTIPAAYAGARLAGLPVTAVESEGETRPRDPLYSGLWLGFVGLLVVTVGAIALAAAVGWIAIW